MNPALPCLVTPHRECTLTLDRLRLELPPGTVAFFGEYSETSRWSGNFTMFHEVVVGPGEDQFAIPVLAGSRCNTGHDLLEKLREYDYRFGLDIRGATRNSVTAALLSWPDLDALVAELYPFCPDPIEIGFAQSPEGWVEMIRAHLEVTFWWQGV